MTIIFLCQIYESVLFIHQLPFTHESLLIDKKELRLSKQEKRLAKQSYAMEKKLNVSYSRPSYAAYYPKYAPGGRFTPRGARYYISVTFCANGEIVKLLYICLKRVQS